MEELLALEISLARILAVDDPVDRRQVFVPPHLRLAEVVLEVFQSLFGNLLPVSRIGVRLEPLRQLPAAGQLGDAIERTENLDHLARVVAVVRHVGEAELVRLRLVVAAELEEQDLKSRAGHLAEARDLRAQDRADPEAHLRQLSLADLVRGVARGDVPALVAHHARELRLGHQRAQDSAGDEDRTTGQRERVHRRVLHHVELPGKALAGGLLRERLPQPADIGLELVVLVETDRLLHLLRGLLAHVDLLRLGDQVELQLAGRGVPDAGRQQGAGRGEGEKAAHDTSGPRAICIIQA